MEEICELEEYSKKLEPIIDMVEKMPELGEILLSRVQPPEKAKRSTVGASATRERIYAALRLNQLTITEIAKEVGINSSWVSTLVKEDVKRGILEKYDRFDQRVAVRIVSEKVRNDTCE